MASRCIVGVCHCCLNRFTPKSDLIDFSLSNTGQFYSSKGDPLRVKGLIISVFHFNSSVITKIYSGIQTYHRSVPLLPLIISDFHFNCSVITKVYSVIQTFHRRVPLLPFIISVFHFNCSVIVVFRGFKSDERLQLDTNTTW